MSLQFIRDSNENATGVFILFEEWQNLKTKYPDLQQVEVRGNNELPSWQNQILEERLNDYYSSPDDIKSFDSTLNDIEKGL